MMTGIIYESVDMGDKEKSLISRPNLKSDRQWLVLVGVPGMVSCCVELTQSRLAK
jgi:hypothetical protein